VALRDNAGKPRFIETLPQRGYPFVAPVELVLEGALDINATNGSQPHAGDRLPAQQQSVPEDAPQWRLLATAALAAIVLFASAGYETKWRAPETISDRPLLRLDLDVGSDDFAGRPELSVRFE